jgi:TolB-like protein
MSRPRKLSFDRFILDPSNASLTLDGNAVPVTPKAFELLCCLVGRAGQLLTKDELFNAVWRRRFVSESVLKDNISDLRRALGDQAKVPRYIETVARRGYRFIAELGELIETEAIGHGAGAPAVSTRSEAQRTVLPGHENPALALPDKPSIAVMPFSNMSGDPEQEYFTDGMVEEIITALSRIRWLFVIARNSSFTYKGRAIDVRQVGHELGVRYVLEGGVRKAANRVRVTAQLIDATTATHLWADRFDGKLDDMFDLQDRMTASVMSAIAPTLEQAEIERAKRKPTDTLDAYDHFSARNVQLSSNGPGEQQRSAAAVPQGDRDRPGFCFRIWHGSVVLQPKQRLIG